MAKETIRRNNPIAIMLYNNAKTEGHHVFEEVATIEHETGTSVTLAPMDVYLENSGFFSLKPKGADELDKRYPLLINQGCRIAIPCPHRTLVLYLNYDSTALKDFFQNTELQDILTLYIELKKHKLNLKDFLRMENISKAQKQEFIVSTGLDEKVDKKKVKDMELYQMVNPQQSERQPQEQKQQ